MDGLQMRGRRVLVAGGSRGLGLHLARSLAAGGALVSICGRDAGDLEAARESLAGHGHHSRACDLADGAQIDQWIEDAAQSLGGMDTLICNATGHAGGDSEADWAGSLAVDVMAPVRCVRAALPHLRRAGDAAIVHIASRTSFGPAPAAPAYGAAKAAVMHLASSQAAAFARDGIRVNCVAPGSLDFPGGWWDRCRVDNPALYHGTLAELPAGRFGTPDDIVPAILFLCSPAARWITGQTLLVDGGQTLAPFLPRR